MGNGAIGTGTFCVSVGGRSGPVIARTGRGRDAFKADHGSVVTSPNARGIVVTCSGGSAGEASSSVVGWEDAGDVSNVGVRGGVASLLGGVEEAMGRGPEECTGVPSSEHRISASA